MKKEKEGGKGQKYEVKKGRKCKKKTRPKEKINICTSKKKSVGEGEWRRKKDLFAGWISRDSRDCEQTIESHVGRERHTDYGTSKFFMER